MLKKALTKFFRRPFPRNLHTLRSCRISYAQFGEDLFLTSLLGYEKTDGVYVDFGCYHPIDYSPYFIDGRHSELPQDRAAIASQIYDWYQRRASSEHLVRGIASALGLVTSVDVLQ